MTQQEFETRTNWTPSEEAFDYINRVYMAAGEIDKDTFCKDYMSHKLHESKVVGWLTAEVETHRMGQTNLSNELNVEVERAAKFRIEMGEFLLRQAQETGSVEIREKAIELLGEREYLRRMITGGFDLWEEDRYAIAKLLSTK